MTTAIRETLKHNLSSISLLAPYNSSACHYDDVQLGFSSKTLSLKAEVCHSTLSSDLTTTTHKKCALVNSIFDQLNRDLAAELTPIVEKHLFSADSMFGDVHHLVTFVPNQTNPQHSVFFYTNDTGENISTYERALIVNLFIFSRFFTEHKRAVPSFLSLYKKGFSFEESIIFSDFYSGIKNYPEYSTHWAFNGPSIPLCARFLFRLGPDKEKEFFNTGLTVNDKLWGDKSLPFFKFDGGGFVEQNRIVRGVFGTYTTNSNEFSYKKASEVGRDLSLRSFLDYYKKEFIK
jgi:hypothetical protein